MKRSISADWSHASIGEKIHRHAIDAIAQMRRWRAVWKDMAEVAAAAAAMHLRSAHAMAAIHSAFDGAVNRIVKARPAGAAFKFFGGREKTLAASGANKRTRPLFVIERATSGRLGAMRPHDPVLLRGQQAPPFFLGMGNFKCFVLHLRRP